MATFMVTKEKLALKQLEKEQDEKDFKTKNLSKNQKREIRENIWYKLYMLQNYNITMDMFLGSDLRWSSIKTYLDYIRALYNGKEYTDVLRSKSLCQYIQGLIDSGTEPFPVIESKDKLVTIQELVDSKVLTPYEINQIYDPVGITEELPDTSSAWTCSHNVKERESSERGEYYTIVEEKPTITNPIISNTMKPNFLGFKLKHGLLNSLNSLFRV